MNVKILNVKILNTFALCVPLMLSCAQEREPMPWEKDPNFGKPSTETSAAKLGETLPDWKEGYLDIHDHNSGRGECSFIIMPDGTTLIIDAGDVGEGKSSYPKVPCKPANTAPVTTYSRYIQHFLPSQCNGKVDYMLLTHYHNDHMGSCNSSEYEMNAEGGYRKTGLMGLYDLVKFGKYVDRCYPDYTAAALETNDYTAGYTQLASFTSWNAKRDGLVSERFKLGSETQFVLKYKASSYPDFKISNVAANGEICVDGQRQDLWGTAAHYENGMSCGILLSFGAFDYLTCGDAGQNGKIEQPLAKALNRRIEAMKANHHFSVNCMTPAAMSILMPRVVVTQSFYERDDQPNTEALKTFYSSYVGEKNLYFTNVVAAQQEAHEHVYGIAAGSNGHVVIRVTPEAVSFFVYMLDDSDFNYKVTKIDGPFNCN